MELLIKKYIINSLANPEIKKKEEKKIVKCVIYALSARPTTNFF